MRTLRDPILRHVYHSLRRLLPDGGHVLVAVSGGRDSMALADAVRRLAPILHLRVTIAHVHHGLRGSEADADRDFVDRSAKRWKVGFVATRVRTNALRRRHRIGIEQAARLLRYRALERMRRTTGADLILTAHHSNDQAETVVLRALRGAHRRGLAGILPVLQHPPVARPLLDVSRRTIDRYVGRRRLRFREDASNADLMFRRNLVRHRLLPLVGRHLKIDAATALPRLASASRSLGDAAERILAEIEPAAMRSARGVHHISAESFLRWPMAIQDELLTRLLRRAALEPTNARLHALRDLMTLPVGRLRPLGGHWQAYRERDGVSLVRVRPIRAGQVTIDAGQSVAIPGGRLRISKPRPVPDALKGPPTRVWVDAGAVRTPLHARLWRPADRIMPFGMSSTRKVSDLLTDRKVPAYRKRLVPVLLSGRRIVWVCGVAIDDRIKVHAGTRQVLQFSFHSNV